MPPLRQEIVVKYDNRGVRHARQDFRRLSNDAEKEFGGLEQKFGRFSGALKGVFAGISAFITTQLIGSLQRVGTELFNIGSAVGETESKFSTVFGGAADSVSEFVSEFSKLSGITERQGKDFTSNIGAIIQGMGAAREESADLSQQLVELAGDLSSFNNTSIEDAFEALRSGLTGEAEPLKRFGIILKEDEVALRALADTGKKAKSDITDLERAQARVNIIFEKAGVAVGDLERTQDSAANTARRLQGRIENLREEFAAKLVPAFQLLITEGERLFNQFENSNAIDVFASGIRTTIFDLITFAEQVRNAIGVIQNLTRSMDDSLFGGSERLSLVEGLTAELGRMANVIVGIQRGFVQISIASAKLQQSFGADRSEFIKQLEAENAALLQQQLELVGLVGKRKELKREFEKTVTSGGADNIAEVLTGGGGARSTATQIKKVELTAKDAARAFEAMLDKLKQIPENPFITILSRDLERFNNEITTLENNFSQGLIDQDFFSGAVAKSSEEFIIKLGGLRNVLKQIGLLTPEVEKAFNEAFKAATKGAEETDEALKSSVDNLESIVSAGRSLLNLASAFGDLSDETERFARGTLDALDNLQRLQQTRAKLAESGQLGTSAGALAQATSVIGIAAGIAQALSPLFDDQGRSMAELSEALRDSARSIRQSVEEFVNAGRPGFDVSGRDAEAAVAARDAFRQALADIGPIGRLQDVNSTDDVRRLSDALKSFTDFGSAIQDAGIDINLQAVEEQLGAALESGVAFEDAIAQIFEDLGLNEIFDSLETNLGGFGDSVEGAVENLRFFSTFLGEEAPAQLERFIEFLTNRVEGIQGAGITDAAGNITQSLAELLAEAGAQDVTTEQGKARIAEIVALVAAALDAGNFELGGLDSAGLEDILRTLQDIAAGAEIAITSPDEGATPEDSFTRSVQIARSITEIQANELIAINESILFVLQSIWDSITGGGFSGVVLPDNQFQPRDPVIGSINVSGLDESMVPGLMVMIENELRAELRGSRRA